MSRSKYLVHVRLLKEVVVVEAEDDADAKEILEEALNRVFDLWVLAERLAGLMKKEKEEIYEVLLQWFRYSTVVDVERVN